VGRKRKQSEPDEPAGTPEWMVTFSDCMTLLLTFFVLLLSFSSFDDQILIDLKVIFAKQFSLSSQTSRKQDSLSAMTQILNDEILNEGSEKPTLSRGVEDSLIKETEPENFHDWKVFLVSSDKIFWGKGTRISFQGRKTLATMASFLKEMPNRIVISENRQGDTMSGDDSGLQRAWAVMEYFTIEQGLDKRQFSISATSTVAQVASEKSTGNGERNLSPTEAERRLEIVLLERSIHN